MNCHWDYNYGYSKSTSISMATNVGRSFENHIQNYLNVMWVNFKRYCNEIVTSWMSYLD